ncbi:MAG: hypothetical protein AAF205_03655 [Pseudomonadota bacterium]
MPAPLASRSSPSLYLALAAALTATAIPDQTLAQATPEQLVDEYEAAQRAGELAGTVEPEDDRSASEKLYTAIAENRNGTAIDRLVGGVLTELDVDCPAIERYQTFSTTASYVSMKIKCADRPVYALTIGPVGFGVISGGDGSIDRMDPEQGDIRIVRGEAPPPRRVARPGPSLNLITLAVFGVALIGGVGGLIWYWTRRHRIIAPWKGLRSEDKDRMLDESEEIWPGVFHHPGGMWIARGRRGKRRLFRNQLFAMAYARHNLKLFQVR